MDGIEFDLSTVQTNMIIFRVNRPGLNAPEYAARLKELGVLVNFISKDHIRVVTHLDVNRKMVEKAADIFAKAL
jgi:threonine aldolase